MDHKFSCFLICFKYNNYFSQTWKNSSSLYMSWRGILRIQCFALSSVYTDPSQMLSQGTAAWVDILGRGCERREWELRICMYPCSFNCFLENKFEITFNFLLSLGTKRGAFLLQGLASHFKSVAWVSSQSVHGEEMVICVSVPPWEFIKVTVVFALQMYFDASKSSPWKRIHSLFLCLFFLPLKSNCDLSFLSQLCFWLFFWCVRTLLPCSPSLLFLVQFTADFWQESIPSYIPEEMQLVMFRLSFSWGLLGFFCCRLSLHHFIFRCGHLPVELIACVLEMLTYKILIPSPLEGEHLADKGS